MLFEKIYYNIIVLADGTLALHRLMVVIRLKIMNVQGISNATR